jgi:hypothetical protein
MLYMNEYEIEHALDRNGNDPVLGPASLTLWNLMRWTNENSDGWAYWPKPCRAAKGLQEFIQKYSYPCAYASPAEYKAALRPIKAFRTRQGADFEIVEA